MDGGLLPPSEQKRTYPVGSSSGGAGAFSKFQLDDSSSLSSMSVLESMKTGAGFRFAVTILMKIFASSFVAAFKPETGRTGSYSE